MEESREHDMDSGQVKKAVQALLAYQKSKKDGNKLLLNVNESISLMVTVWRIPHRPEVIRIPLPHGIRPDTCEVCLFTRDEPEMSSDQTEKFYKKLLAQHGVTHINEIIPYKRLKTEYKPYEAKRRLLGTFDLFLADGRIRRLLPSHLGKHFYKEKREPQSVNLKAKHLAYELNRFIHGTQLHITNKGCCYSIRVGHTAMKAEDIVENIVAVAVVLAEKLPMKWKNVKVLHLKTQKSVSLPVYNSPIDIIKELSLTKDKREGNLREKKMKPAKESKPATPVVKKRLPKKKARQAIPDKKPSESVGNDEEIPELVPIVEPASTKKAKKRLNSSKTPEKKIKATGHIHASSQTLSGKNRKIVDHEAEEEPKIPSKNKKEQTSKQESADAEGQESAPRQGILKKHTKARGRLVIRLTKSAKKATLTPKLRQKKKLKAPQSV